MTVIAYTSASGMLDGTLVSQTGSQCAPDDEFAEDTLVLAPYTVTATTLTVIATDPTLDPPTVTFVFTKSS